MGRMVFHSGLRAKWDPWFRLPHRQLGGRWVWRFEFVRFGVTWGPGVFVLLSPWRWYAWYQGLKVEKLEGEA